MAEPQLDARVSQNGPPPGSELEFWSSEGWIDIWAGIPLRVPATGSAAGLVRNALLPGSNVNFPQITEICERVLAHPQEGPEAIGLLVAALRDDYAAYRKKLKALTISNEMMYDEYCRSTFCAIDGLREALGSLRNAKDTGLGAAMDGNIRMLATEIDRTCFEGGPLPQHNGLRNLAASIGSLAAGLRRERSDQGMAGSSPSPTKQENAFYYDEKVKRWRQKGVPDEFDAVPTTGAMGATSSQASGASVVAQTVPTSSLGTPAQASPPIAAFSAPGSGTASTATPINGSPTNPFGIAPMVASQPVGGAHGAGACPPPAVASAFDVQSQLPSQQKSEVSAQPVPVAPPPAVSEAFDLPGTVAVHPIPTSDSFAQPAAAARSAVVSEAVGFPPAGSAPNPLAPPAAFSFSPPAGVAAVPAAINSKPVEPVPVAPTSPGSGDIGIATAWQPAAQPAVATSGGLASGSQVDMGFTADLAASFGLAPCGNIASTPSGLASSAPAPPNGPRGVDSLF